jgi:hypothetical protein
MARRDAIESWRYQNTMPSMVAGQDALAQERLKTALYSSRVTDMIARRDIKGLKEFTGNDWRYGANGNLEYSGDGGTTYFEYRSGTDSVTAGKMGQLNAMTIDKQMADLRQQPPAPAGVAPSVMLPDNGGDIRTSRLAKGASMPSTSATPTMPDLPFSPGNSAVFNPAATSQNRYPEPPRYTASSGGVVENPAWRAWFDAEQRAMAMKDAIAQDRYNLDYNMSIGAPGN